MSPRRRVVLLWAVLGAFVLACTLALWGSMAFAWRCYRLHEDGARAHTELVKKLDGLLVLQFTSGPQRDQACTAKTSEAHYAAAELGDPLEVVYFDDRPGDCVLMGTFENSGILLWSISAGLGFGLLLVLGFGLFLQRSFTERQGPRRRMQVEPGSVQCPACGKEMEEGYVPLLAGINWRQIGEPIGLPHALQGLPGTVGWRGRPRLHAFRCQACEILTFQYGTADRPGVGSGLS